MTLQEIYKFIEDPEVKPSITQTEQSPATDEPGDFFHPFNPAVLHNNYNGIPDISSSQFEQYLQERAIFPANELGVLALKLFKDGIDFEAEKSIKNGENTNNYTYWVRPLNDDSPEGYSLEFGLRGGSERPTIQAIMARCAVENGLPSRDVSENSLSAFVIELARYQDIDRQATEENVHSLSEVQTNSPV